MWFIPYPIIFKYHHFQEYGSHFQTNLHIDAMKRAKLRLQQGLQMMRKKQRENQKEIDCAALDCKREGIKKQEKSGYCKVCKLLFKHQSKTEHEETEFHKKIDRFLYPSCNVCKVPKFFSPMAYEKHIATLGHIKVSILEPINLKSGGRI